MKLRPVVLALAGVVIFPFLAFCQSQQYVNCHTPESSGNFVGANETIVNGMVCQVAKAQPTVVASNQPASPSAGSPKATSTESNSAITDARVVELSKLGLDDDIVIAKIRNGNCQFQLGDSDLVALKNAGVSAKVIAAMLDAGTPATPNAASVSSVAKADEPTSAPPSDAATSEPAGQVVATGQIPAGARIVIAPMGGFETYFAAAVREKKVPIKLTLDKNSAQYFVVSTETEWQGFVYGSGGSANWNQNGGSAAHGSAASSTRGLEASIMLLDAKTKDVVWAYEVHKNSHGALLFGTHAMRGQQSLAEACAKHLKEFIEKGR